MWCRSGVRGVLRSTQRKGPGACSHRERLFQHQQAVFSAASALSFQDKSAIPTQSARVERRRQCQVYEVMRLCLKALLGISDVVEVQTFVCARALHPLMQLVGSDAFANELRVVSSKVLCNLARNHLNHNRLYKEALTKTVFELRLRAEETQLPDPAAASRARPATAARIAARNLSSTFLTQPAEHDGPPLLTK